MAVLCARTAQVRVGYPGYGIGALDDPMKDKKAQDWQSISSLFELILEMDRSVHGSFGLEMLSHEFRLVGQLFARHRSTVKDATHSSLLSSRAFYELLKRMTEDGLVRTGPHPQDGRAKLLQLDEDFCRRLIERLLPHAGWAKLAGEEDGAEPGLRART